MVTDARGHEVPADSDMWGYREDMGLLSESIADVRPVANQAAAQSAVAELEAGDVDPAGTVWWFASPGGLYYYTGTEWQQVAAAAEVDTRFSRLPYATASGRTTVTDVDAYTSKSATVTLPVGRFTQPPTMVATAPTSNPSLRMATANATGTGSCTVYVYNGTNTARDITANWIGIQDSAAAALAALALDDEGPDVTVTCPTPGCVNQGLPIPIASTWVDDNDGTTHTVDQVQCGVCGTDITDTMQPIEGS